MEHVPFSLRASTPSRADVARRWAPVAVLLAAAFVASLLSGEAADIFGPVVVMLGHGTAGWLFLRKSSRFDGRERVAWTLVGAGLSIASVGVLVVAVIGIVRGSAPAFGPTDLIFVASYALIIGGFASLPHISGSPAQRVRLFLDGTIGAISLAVVLWALVLYDLIRRVGDAPFWERLIASTYPVFDVAALIMILWVAVRRSSYRFDVRLLLFGASLAAQSAADIAFFVTGVGRTFEEAHPPYGVFAMAAAGFVAVGVLLERVPAQREYAERGSPLWALVAPYSAAVVLLGLLAYVELFDRGAGTQTGLFVSAFLVAGLVVVRQAVAIRENRLLVERQREALVSSISHELRTPLTSMVGFLELMNDDEVDAAEQRELTDIVHQQAAYMSRIVSDLVLLARDNPDEIGLRLDEVHVRDVVLESVTTVDPHREMTEIEVTPGLVADVDRDRIEQVLVNFLSNAVRYGGTRRLVRALADGRDLVLEVHDNGAGVRKKYELMIWERFERGQHRYNAANPGSGIGLAVVDAIARAHGGSASYRRSELMGGACFSVVLPGRARRRAFDAAVRSLPLAEAG